MLDVKVHRIAMDSPYDLSGLRSLVDGGQIDPADIVAILAKTEGNGCVNDFSRGYSSLSFKTAISEYLNTSLEEIEKRVICVMSGGTEGVMSPHATIFSLKEVCSEPSGEKKLSIGVVSTRDILDHELGTVDQSRVVANSVRMALEKARIDDFSDVHFVQIKCPLLTSKKIAAAEKCGKKLVVNDTYKSMAYSRAASALGVALALGEIEEKQLSNEVICKDWGLFSKVASVSAGEELVNCEILLMGNSLHSRSKYRIGHGVMKDAIDMNAVIEACYSAGLSFNTLPTEEQKNRIVNIFAKAEADPTGFVRGRRHTMLTDSDINHTRHARAAVNAVIAAFLGDPMVYVSGGAEHQGPAGGGPVSVIVGE